MDFKLDSSTDSLRLRIRKFVDDELIPLEARPDAYDAHENINEDTLTKYRAKAREAGLWALQMPVAQGSPRPLDHGHGCLLRGDEPVALRSSRVQQRAAR